MRAHTRKYDTNNFQSFSLEEEGVPAEEIIEKFCRDKDLPQWAVMLSGLRYREGLTQKALGEILGLKQTNISKMENGKRPIGKNVAKRLADLFHTDYRLFL